MLNRNRYDNASPDGHAVMEVAEGRGRWFIPLLRTELSGAIGGPLAEMRLTQVFRFGREEMDKVVEARYRFPLPGDASVSSVKVSFGDTEIATELKEREGAEWEHQRARHEGRRSAMVEREAAGVLTLSVAGIAPDEDVRVTTCYLQLGEAEGAGFRFRVPLTTAPRYVRDEDLHGRQGRAQPLVSLRDPGHRFSMVMASQGGTLSSGTHPLSLRGGVYGLAEGETVPDRDLVISWSPDEDEERTTLKVLSDGIEEPAFLALLTPPRAPDDAGPREVIVMVDHSGSMSGAKWEAADWAVERFLSGLGGRDRFNLCLFHSRSKWLATRPILANEKNIARALSLLKDGESGGTRLADALEEALSQPRRGDVPARHVLVITDAQVGDAGGVLDLVDAESEREGRRRCSIICIDSAPNSHLANEMSRRGGGIARFLSSSPEEGDISSALEGVLESFAAPLAVNAAILCDRPSATSVEAEDGWHRLPLGDLISGRTSWACGRLAAGDGPPRFRFDGEEVEAETMGAVRALHAAKRIDALEQALQAVEAGRPLRLDGIGLTPAEADAAAGGEEGLRRLIAAESIGHGVLSSETAFVGSGTSAGRRVEASVTVPSALPDGWDPSFAYPMPMAAFSEKEMRSVPDDQDLIMYNRMDARLLYDEAPALRAYEEPWTAFSGEVVLQNGEALLFDGIVPGGRGRRLRMLSVRFIEKLPPRCGASLLVFIGDMALPQVKVGLEDLRSRGGMRPLNASVRRGERVRMVLVDEDGTLAGLPLEVELS